MSETAKTDERLEQYARLTVQVGLNLQPGQTLGINALIEHAPFARAIAREAYAAGASYVDVLYTDQHVRRAHIEQAADDQLGFSPPWLVRRLSELGEIGGALCAITGNPEPELFADLDGERVGKARMRDVAEGVAEADRRPLQLDDRRLPERGLGEDRVRRAGRRAALGGGRRRPCASTSPTRSPPGASTSTACSSARSR